ncbi:MAG: uracil-DNA glycosylase [Deltaproteobacteria bacterium]|nr:uracil-DNA glycosylase [Deltaproteobacteria bacterium]
MDVPDTAPARAARLDKLADEVSRCTRCKLHETRTNTVFSRGSAGAELVFVGEGPGADEDAQGVAFVGKAGQLLDRMVVAMGYGRDDVYICNVVKCRPPSNRKPEPNEIAACLPYLKEQLALLGPKAIVCLGATGVQALLGASVGITRMRGTWKLYGGRVPLMPTFHPAYLLRQPEKKRDVWNDLQQVMKRLGKEPPTKQRGDGGNDD